VRLRVTGGVIEEIERHMNLALVCSRHQHERWHGHVPFLYLAFVWSGRSRGELPAWLERFRGDLLPEQDIADYLREMLGVVVGSLSGEVQEAPDELRIAVHEYWSQVQERRRSVPDPMLTARLAQHDVENYLGVMERRRQQQQAPFGYTTWWVTLDRAAYQAAESISKNVTVRFTAPVLSPDFLVNYLAIGPVRAALAKSTESILPLMIRELQSLELLPAEVLQAAEELRVQLEGQPPHVIHRRVRDLLLKAQSQLGPMAAAGTPGMQEALRLLLTEATLASSR
jgi:hypothetical protein